MKLISFLACRYLNLKHGGARTARLGATVASGIVLGTFLVFLSLGILSGAHQAYRQALLGFNAHVILYKEGFFDSIEQGQIEDFMAGQKGQDASISASPFLAIESLMPTREGLKPIMLKGVDLARLREVYQLKFEKRDEGASDLAAVYLGSEVAALQPESLSSTQFRLMTVARDDSLIRTRITSLPVAGTFKSGIHDFDAQFVLADIKWLQAKYFKDQRVTGYEIRLSNPEDAAHFVQKLRARFGDAFLAMTWDELNAELFEILAREKITTFSIATMVILICCLNMVGFAILFFVLHEREFGVLSVLGAPLMKLRVVLAVISVVAGASATLLGAGLSSIALRAMMVGRGVPLDPEVYYLDRIPVHIEPLWFLGFTILSVVLCFAASLIASFLILRRRVAGLALVG